MQEDAFLKYFWSTLGSSVRQPEIPPLVSRQHSESMFSSLDRSRKEDQRLNFLKQLALTCRNDPRRQRAIRKRLGKRIIENSLKTEEGLSLEQIRSTMRELRQYDARALGLAGLIQKKVLRLKRFVKSK